MNCLLGLPRRRCKYIEFVVTVSTNNCNVYSDRHQSLVRCMVVGTIDVEPWPQLCQLNAPITPARPAVVYYILYTQVVCRLTSLSSLRSLAAYKQCARVLSPWSKWALRPTSWVLTDAPLDHAVLMAPLWVKRTPDEFSLFEWRANWP